MNLSVPILIVEDNEVVNEENMCSEEEKKE